MTTWPWSRHRSASRPSSSDPASVLREHPVLLLAGPPADVMVNRLLRMWNPCAELGGPKGNRGIAEGVRWFGPYRLDTVGAAEAGLPLGWSTAYAAQTVRSRLRVPDGLAAAEMRERFPHGMPVGTEAVAWSLVTGLARRLGGAARLPVDARSRRVAARGAKNVVTQRPEVRQNTYCVYGNKALPWAILRSLLALSLPELDLNGALAVDDYCLDRTGSFEVRVEPFRDGDFLPYALRPGAAPGWPCTVYRFRCLPEATNADAARIDVQLRGAAYELADIVGGALLDGEGFPVITEFARQRS
ncbi:hypothetical protein [Actinospica sp.]|uniref:hypothetical protein n=1 Tax=Actinospica sp. TaxID=1872142 RepID=UPI002C06B0DF|nr:hypothetical protein [Actinospica sp.]HWG23785.1 hypothetical protein [Actinospica sp.]